LEDRAVLALAAQSHRVLVSHDLGTMPRHFRAYRDAGNHSPGVILIPQSMHIGTAIEELVLIWLASDQSEWADRLVWLPI